MKIVEKTILIKLMFFSLTFKENGRLFIFYLSFNLCDICHLYFICHVFIKHHQLLYISTSVWVLRTPNAGWNSHFQRFCCKKPKKQEICRNLQQIFAKNSFFKFAPKRWLTVLLPKKWAFFFILFNTCWPQKYKDILVE